MSWARLGDSGPLGVGLCRIHREFIALCFPGFTMKVLLEGLFVAVVLLLEAVGVIVLGRSTQATETYTLASPNAAPTAYFFTSEDDKDGGVYWLEWEDTSCDLMMEVPGKEGDLENFEVRRSGKEVVGIGEAAGCRGKLVPYVASTRHPGVRPPGSGH